MTENRSTPGSIVAAVPGPFDAVIFDNDGLLLDTEDAWTRAETTLFARRGSTFTMEHKRALLGTSVAQAALKLEAMLAVPGEGPQLMDELHELVMGEVVAGVPIRPGARELVESLRTARVPVGLATNSSRAFVERVLGSSGFRNGEFDTVVSADDVELPKPAPDIYVAACTALGADPARAAALEDSPPGVAAARAAGMFVIGVPYFPDQRLEGASLIAPSLADPSVVAALGFDRAERD
jgi:beta-phosphoglucomutase-like phosphatase (HAD superfamily)